MPRRSLPFLAAFLALVVSACAGPSMDGDPSPQRYAISVTNEMPHPMVVSVVEGPTARLLGTVGAQRSERFVLDDVESTTITLVAHDREDTHTVRRTVVLEAGSTVEVRIN